VLQVNVLSFKMWVGLSHSDNRTANRKYQSNIFHTCVFCSFRTNLNAKEQTSPTRPGVVAIQSRSTKNIKIPASTHEEFRDFFKFTFVHRRYRPQTHQKWNSPGLLMGRCAEQSLKLKVNSLLGRPKDLQPSNSSLGRPQDL